MRRLLVLWDVDFTLIDAGGVGRELYRVAFREVFGRELFGRGTSGPASSPPEPGGPEPGGPEPGGPEPGGPEPGGPEPGGPEPGGPEPGGPEPPWPAMAGRTDRAIAIEVLALAGISEPGLHVAAFHAAMAARAATLADLVRQRSRALPGAAAALAALAGLNGDRAGVFADEHSPGGHSPGSKCPGEHSPGEHSPGSNSGSRADRPVVQSLLTGNIRALAEVKLRPLGLTDRLDLDIGAYGDAHEIRADLVPVARRNAARRYRHDFAGADTVLIGDTPLDVEAALVNGARAVGVATGGFSVAELAAAGANAVMPDLADTESVLAAVLGLAPGS